MNFYKHHLGDYDGATAHLSWDEDMAYTRLLRAYYRREKPLTDAAEAYRLIRAVSKAHRGAVDAVLTEFFEFQDDGWHNKRADEEIEAYQAQAAHNRVVGNLGGRPKKTTVVTQNNQSGSETKPVDNPNQEPLTKNQNHKPEKAKARRAPQTPLPEGFKISERVTQWAAGKGYQDLEKHLESFISKARAKAYVYADWDEALMTAIRDDWAGLRSGKYQPATQAPPPKQTCGKCGGSLSGGHVYTQEHGNTCNTCYHARAA